MKRKPSFSAIRKMNKLLDNRKIKRKDSDRDGVPDMLDCRPHNPRRQGIIHTLPPPEYTPTTRPGTPTRPIDHSKYVPTTRPGTPTRPIDHSKYVPTTRPGTKPIIRQIPTNIDYSYITKKKRKRRKR